MYTVYLIHFQHKYKHAQHYIGYTVDLDNRLNQHANGKGGRLLEVINQANIPWKVVRTWKCNQAFEARELEKKLKSWHNSKKFCPVCNLPMPCNVQSIMECNRILMKSHSNNVLLSPNSYCNLIFF